MTEADTYCNQRMYSQFHASIIMLFSLLLLMVTLVGCRNETYFGPYQIEVPTEIQERSAGRTFRMPLNAGESRQLEQQTLCEASEPDRQAPCRCDYPVLTVGKKLTRLDYRLTHNANEPVSVMVWIGVEVSSGMELPSVLPDLPQVEVLSEHMHVLMPGEILDKSFLESEWTEMEQAWTSAYFPECDESIQKRPAPYEVLIGSSLVTGSTAQVTLEFTVRIRGGR
jgi:hypothetical protein